MQISHYIRLFKLIAVERIITKSFARLMGRGTHRGFITYEELSKSLGKRNLSDENLAQAFIHILNENVSLVEKKSDFKVLRKKENSSKRSQTLKQVPIPLKGKIYILSSSLGVLSRTQDVKVCYAETR